MIAMEQTSYCYKLFSNIGRRVFLYFKRLAISVWKVILAVIMFCLRKRRDSGEQDERTSSCEQCLKYEKDIDELQENLRVTIDTAEKERESLKRKVEKYKLDTDILIRQNMEIKERSEQLTSSMATILETKGDLENVNDEYANAKLAKSFQNIYDNQWASLSDWLFDKIPSLDELTRIDSLAKLTKTAYEECVLLAERQLRQFLFLDDDTDIKSLKEQETSEVSKVRKDLGQQTRTREAVKKDIIKKVVNTQNVEVFLTDETATETRKKLEEFFLEYIDLCWLMTISYPKLVLDFDVIGKPYSGNIKERFTQFSTQDKVRDTSLKKDYVAMVVWPCVVLEDGSGVYAKGDLITVDIGKEG